LIKENRMEGLLITVGCIIVVITASTHINFVMTILNYTVEYFFDILDWIGVKFRYIFWYCVGFGLLILGIYLVRK